MGKEGRKFAVKNFDIENYIDHLKIYEDLIMNKSKSLLKSYQYLKRLQL